MDIKQEARQAGDASESNIKQELPLLAVKSENADGGSCGSAFATTITSNNRQSSKSRVEAKRAKPIIVLDDDDDDDVQVVETRLLPTPIVQPNRTTATPVAATHNGTSAVRERKLIKMRLEELRLERRLMEME